MDLSASGVGLAAKVSQGKRGKVGSTVAARPSGCGWKHSYVLQGKRCFVGSTVVAGPAGWG